MIPLLEKRGLIIAIASALIAVILAVTWLNQQQRRLAEDLNKKFGLLHTNVIDGIFAKADIPRGKIITEEMLYTRPMTKDSLPAAAATSIARVIDRVVTASIKKDSLISVDMIGWPTTRETTLAGKTPIGKRASTISVDNIASLSGMIKPGDYVDVIALILLPTQIEGKQSTQPATVPLFQNVLILAVGSQIGKDEEAGVGLSKRRREGESSRQDSAPLITLALSPEETNLLAFVQEQGKIRLVLRSPGDAKTESIPPASWETLFKHLFPNIDLTKPEVKEEPRVEVIRGFKKETLPLRQSKENENKPPAQK